VPETSPEKGAWGFVTEDCSGDALQAGAGNLSNLRDAFQAELLASMAGMKGTDQLGIQKKPLRGR
jgi:hypothetical protein